jgi:hypothetical protein
MVERAQAKQFSFPYLYDESQVVATNYAAQRTPEIFVFDSKGVLQYHGAFDDSYDDESAVKHTFVRDAVEAILGQTLVKVNETPAIGCTIKWKPTPISIGQ